MAHQALASALRQIARKASHPNALVYEMQKERAKREYLPNGQLRLLDGNGKEDVLALGDGVVKDGNGEEAKQEGRNEFAVKVNDRMRENGSEGSLGGMGAEEVVSEPLGRNPEPGDVKKLEAEAGEGNGRDK